MSKFSPRAGTSSEVTHPEALPSSSSLPSEGREKRVGPRVAHCVASHGASSPPARLGPARGVEVLLDARPVLVGTSVSSAPSGAAGVPGVAHCGGRLLPAMPRPRSALTSYHCTPFELMS